MSVPSKVFEAISGVMSDIKILEKSSENQHARYKFAGIDDFLEVTRPLCAKHGLVIVQDEDGFEVVEGGWLLIRFAFRLYHTSGDSLDAPIRRSIMVQAKMGSQAFGAAQSYALKQFMRSLFQMATGDGEDADSHPQTELSQVKKSASQAKKDGDWDRIVSAIEGCLTVDELDAWLQKMEKFWPTLPMPWKDAAMNEVLGRKERIFDAAANA